MKVPNFEQAGKQMRAKATVPLLCLYTLHFKEGSAPDTGVALFGFDTGLGRQEGTSAGRQKRPCPNQRHASSVAAVA